jgi:hypothetical protein
MKFKIIVLSCILLLTFGCSQTTEPEIPGWVNNLISDFKAQPVGNPQQSIWQYEYKEQLVYFVPAQCCDQFSTLYDSNGNIVCAPDGGVSGAGDGRCPDFLSVRKNEKLIWKDSRLN